MQLTHLNTLDTLRRVQGFLDTHSTALGAVVTPTLRTRLDDAATKLAAFQVEQGASAGAALGETANQATFRLEFYSAFMRPIARIAKASLRTAAEFPTLVVPSRGLRNGDFVGATQALADAAAKYEKTFVEHGMPADFLAQLRAAIAQLATSKDAHDRNLSRRAAATKGIKDSTKTARDILVVLDALIAPDIKHNAALLADWKASKRIAVAVTSLPAQPLGLPVTDPTTAAMDTTTPGAPAPTPTPAEPSNPSAAPTVAPPSTTTAAAPAPQPATPAV